MTENVQIGEATLYCGDCLEILPTLGKVDGVVTSPPYGTMRDYGGHGSVNTLQVIQHVSELLSDGSVCMWNTNCQTVNGSETGESFKQALHAIECGMNLHDTMIYCKEGVTFPDSNRYHPAFEYMFIFSQGSPRCFHGLKDWRNKWAGSPMHGTDRQKSGESTPIRGIGKPVQAEGLRRNWWPISNPYTGETAGHPAPMPKSMASDHIQTWTNPGDSILDPFMGGGTTGVACANLGRKFIGIEIEPKYFDIACERIEAAYAQGRLFA
jgi:hypothetical protein